MVLVVIGVATLPALDEAVRATQTVWRERQPQWTTGNILPALRPSAMERLGALVADLTDPAESVQGFGYLPGVYLQARRPNAARFITTEKLGQVGAHADWIRGELWQTLRDEPPALLFVPGGDVRFLNDEAAPRWLEEHYELSSRHEGTWIFLQR